MIRFDNMSHYVHNPQSTSFLVFREHAFCLMFIILFYYKSQGIREDLVV